MSLLVLKTIFVFSEFLWKAIYVIKVELMNLLAVSPAKINIVVTCVPEKGTTFKTRIFHVDSWTGFLRLPLRGRVDAGGT